MSRGVPRWGAMFAFLGGATGFAAARSPAQDVGAFVDPSLVLVVAVVWGATVGAAIGGLVGASPGRMTLVLGYAATAGALGAIAGLAFAVHALGEDLLDGSDDVQTAASFVGAGAAWCIGAAIAMARAPGTPALTDPQRRWARGVAVAIVVAGVGVALWVTRGPERPHAQSDASWAQTAIVLDAVLVAATVLLVAGRGTDPRRAKEPVVTMFARAALLVACGLTVALLAAWPGSAAGDVADDRLALSTRTAWSLADAAQTYAESEGTLPPDVATLEEWGGKVHVGTVVADMHRTDRALCVTVAAEGGHGEAIPPFASSTVHVRRTRSGGLRSDWTGSGVGPCEVTSPSIGPSIG